MANILTEIVEYKRTVELPRQRETHPLVELERHLSLIPAPLNFESALRSPARTASNGSNKVALIAEVKKASPSKGLLCPNFDPAQLAQAYYAGGAAALSVLTDEKFFQGHLDYLETCKAATLYQLPVLRKDFVVDPYQVVQARAYQADAILLIMACLEDKQARELFDLATSLRMSILVEVHNEAELERALRLGANIIGINNRDLTTFKVDLNTTTRLAQLLPSNFEGVLVSESGISSHSEIEKLHDTGVNAVLIGETLVKAASTETGLDTTRIEQKISELFNPEMAIQ